MERQSIDLSKQGQIAHGVRAPPPPPPPPLPSSVFVPLCSIFEACTPLPRRICLVRRPSGYCRTSPWVKSWIRPSQVSGLRVSPIASHVYHHLISTLLFLCNNLVCLFLFNSFIVVFHALQYFDVLLHFTSKLLRKKT